MFESIKLYHQGQVRLEQLTRQLVAFGYTRQERVGDVGDFSVRGGVVDVFPATYECPIRMELAGTRLHGIWNFNPDTGELLDRHTLVIILPVALKLRFSEEVPLEHFVDIERGDLVVHVTHGIGRYLGMERLRTDGHAQDQLVIEYADGDRLYVPAEESHLVQKYVGFEGRPPRLYKLGSGAWERAKLKAREGAWQYARQLLDIQARRMALEGFACPSDTEWQHEFERAFPYRETADQRRATDDIKRDMESRRPMDRLLLGDVGYGKTEVAVRAAFKAVMSGKQVAVLAPTTILAEQHWMTFQERMRAYPITVQMLSRFKSPAEQTQIVRRLRDGACDIIIGTHRLLSGDIAFKELGLVIIDEEQRFGVKAKEQLKQLRHLVDVLVLSATPIPRTLYLAMVGTRDMSLITTAPENRHPIETIVAAFDEGLIRQAIRRELRRRGQVFVVHNRIYDLAKVREKVQELAPEARCAMAHGRMDDAELEQVMRQFIHGEQDVLVTTTIIASGIDIPNVNTIILNHAERFGLSELYQLRGRVGRFDRRAYCLLLTPPKLTLPTDARTRLGAILKHQELGAGFKIAMEDLKLRGAGNLLGVEQHGHISAVGFDLYCRLLREAVHAMKELAQATR